MFRLPKSAQIYLVVIVVAGILATVGSQTLPLPSQTQQAWEYIVLAAFAILLGGQKISFNKRRKQEQAMSLTLGFAVTFAAMIRMGPVVSVPIAMLSCLSGCLYPRRQKWHQLAFNVALSSIEAFVAGIAYLALNGWNVGLDPFRTFVAVSLTAVVFCFVNTAGVAQMVSLCSGEKAVPIWRESFGWTAPSYIASACAGALAVVLFHSSTIAMLLFVVPIAYFVYRSFSAHLDHVQENLEHVEQLQAKQTELANLYRATMESLALAIDAKDAYTHKHIVRAQRYAVAIASEMGVSGDDLEGLRTGALLHDIGKLGVPEHVLLKPGPLSAAEFEEMKKHPMMGAAILEPVAFPWPVLPVVKYHHEKWDGSGYPSGLKGEEIPLTARIMAIADVYDALTSLRSYRNALSHEQATAAIVKDSGRHFDPAVVDAFLRIIDSILIEMAQEGIGPLVQEPRHSHENFAVPASAPIFLDEGDPSEPLIGGNLTVYSKNTVIRLEQPANNPSMAPVLPDDSEAARPAAVDSCGAVLR